MREIKFRVWNTIKKKFSIDPEDYVAGHNSEMGLITINSEFYIAQQFIGIKDKNEKEVFEGDLLKYDNNKYLVEVRWTHEGHDHHPAWIIRNLHTQWGDFEVIGNIFEDAEKKEADYYKAVN